MTEPKSTAQTEAEKVAEANRNRPVTNISVTGGAGGVEANLEDLAVLGDLTDDVGETALAIAVSTHRFLADPDVIASAVLNPSGVARFEEALLAALDGEGGLTRTAAAIALRGPALRASAEAYRLTDQLNAKALDASRWLAGRALAPVVLGGALSAIGLALSPMGLIVAGGAVGAGVAAGVKPEDLTKAASKFLAEHPGIADEIIRLAPGLASALGVPTDLATLTKVVSQAFPDGEAKLIDGGLDESQSGKGAVPHGIGDLVDGLNHRNDTAKTSADQKNPALTNLDYNLDIRKITGPDGKVAYVIDIPGTRPEFGVKQLFSGTNANDMGSNVDSMAGNQTALQKGVEEAMRKAGVHPGDPVMLVGHSQGGMIAAQIAHDHRFNVTHVITAGSPIGRMPIPDNVQVLSLENNGDVVPHLDGAENPSTPNRTTVKFDHQAGDFLENHGVKDNYTKAAHDLDKSTDPSVQRFRDGAKVFTTGSDVQTTQYKVERMPEPERKTGDPVPVVTSR
jgi:predicted esterase